MKKTKQPIDILLEAIVMVEDKKLRKLILQSFEAYHDELIEFDRKIRAILEK